MYHLLLLSSFALERTSIFITTVTGAMLVLSHGDVPSLKNLNFPMGMLYKNNWEFEYLTASIAFLQGLFHWLASVAVELWVVPKEGEGVAAHCMNQFTYSAVMMILVAMISLLYWHVTFYKNYGNMLRQFFCHKLLKRFYGHSSP
jgi:hypothetical protein